MQGCLVWYHGRNQVFSMHYPNPINSDSVIAMIGTEKGGIPTVQEIKGKLPLVFQGQVRVMDFEQFHITLTKKAVPFYVKTRPTMPFVYKDKLKAQLEFLQQQGIIAPIAEAHSYVHQF